jgi:opacity protein-like surface antigen
MKISTLAASVALSALMVTGAVAADVFTGDKSLKDDANYASGGIVNWTGFYIGGSVGYGNANHDLSIQRYNSAYCWDQFGNQLAWTDLADTFGPGLDGVLGDNPTTEEDESKDDVLLVDRKDGVQDADELTTGNGTKPPKDSTNPSRHGEDGGKVFAVNSAGTCANESVPDARNLGGIAADDSIAVGPDSKEIRSIDGVNSHGLVGDGRIGFDIARGRFLFGVYGAYGFSNMDTEINDMIGISNRDRSLDLTSIEKGDEWSIGARAGLLVDPRTLAYILAAYTQTDYTFSGNVTDADGTRGFSRDTTFDGVTVGGGVEFAVTSNLFLGIEGTHTFYGKETVLDTGGTEVGGFGQRIEDEIGETKVMGTLKLKLNGGLGN